ncbi:MAG: hypothetical protein RIQ56_1000, partial [Candidatus Parcubacteria bacterium]
MESLKEKITRNAYRPIFIGIFAVSSVFFAGVGVAFLTDVAVPETVGATIVAPPCCT